jgi:hypothetical protein
MRTTVAARHRNGQGAAVRAPTDGFEIAQRGIGLFQLRLEARDRGFELRDPGAQLLPSRRCVLRLLQPAPGTIVLAPGLGDFLLPWGFLRLRSGRLAQGVTEVAQRVLFRSVVAGRAGDDEGLPVRQFVDAMLAIALQHRAGVGQRLGESTSHGYQSHQRAVTKPGTSPVTRDV